MSFCAYFDILGFSEKIQKNDIPFFETYLKVLEKELAYIKDYHEHSGFELKIFTDNFVLGHPWYDEYGESELGNIFNVLARLQYTFIQSNIFIRGAVSMSELYMDENIVLGPALIEAYKLESEKAIYPRIVLDDKVVEVIKKHTRYYSEPQTSPQNKEYLIDIDGQHFINYLYDIVDHYMDYEKEIEKLIAAHRDTVTTNLKAHRENYKLFEKYAWVGRYHNYFCETFLKRFETIDIAKLKIQESLIYKQMGRIV